MTVANPGPATIDSWSVNFTFTDGQQVTQYWETELDQTGARVTAGNVAWNGTLAPGTSATFGFLGSWDGANSVPTLSCATG